MPLIRSGEEKKGSNTAILIGDGRFCSEIGDLADTEYFHFNSPRPKPEDVLLQAQELEREIEEKSLKRLTLIATDWGGPIAIQYAATFPRNVRRVVLLDARARLTQSILELLIEKVEEYLPLGLPLRPLSRAFDPRPILHRVRCPTLILSSAEYQNDAAFLLARIPNAWSEPLDSEKLSERISSFLAVPTKQPQKLLSRAAAGDKL